MGETVFAQRRNLLMVGNFRKGSPGAALVTVLLIRLGLAASRILSDRCEKPLDFSGSGLLRPTLHPWDVSPGSCSFFVYLIISASNHGDPFWGADHISILLISQRHPHLPLLVFTRSIKVPPRCSMVSPIHLSRSWLNQIVALCRQSRIGPLNSLECSQSCAPLRSLMTDLGWRIHVLHL